MQFILAFAWHACCSSAFCHRAKKEYVHNKIIQIMYFNFFQVVRNSVISLFCLLILISCGGRDDVFVAEVETIASPEETVELTAEKIDTDDVYSEWFAVYDSLLISSLPNSNDCFFYVADIKNDTLLGTYLRHGQGPSEYLGLNPVRRIERKGDDLVALTYEPNRKEIIEWNITKSIETGQDSVLQLGNIQMIMERHLQIYIKSGNRNI